MEVHIESGWKRVLQAQFEAPYFAQLAAFVKNAYLTTRVFPPAKDVFAAFTHCPWDTVRVVILGQDPYHSPGQAHGLCFSVPDGMAVPPSLENIFTEIHNNIQQTHPPPPSSGQPIPWATQGVLLLNAVLTVQAHTPASHANQGWETFTDAVIATLSEHKHGLVFMLWGNYAKHKSNLIDTNKHLVLRTSHPSPFSVNQGFEGCQHFTQANTYLNQQKNTPIQWEAVF